MKELVFEIGTEEMPAGFVPQALRHLRMAFTRWMEEERVRGRSLKAVGTPRRLALLAELPEEQEPMEVVKLGPPRKVAFDAEGRPTKAARGFARQQGVKLEDLMVVETERGEYVAVKERRKGRPTRELLKEFLPKLIQSIPLPKAMRWADLRLRFIRPIHWIVAVFGGEVVEFELDGLKSGRTTRGHRFMAPGEIVVRAVKDYLEGLRSAYVLVDPEERYRRLQEAIEEAASRAGGKALEEEPLLEEVTHLVEWPVAVLGRFEEQYLQLPKEVLVTAMEHHQRYFPVVDEKGELLPCFVAVSNTLARDMDMVRQGNERVLKARLADARFFYEEDLKVPLEQRVEDLRGMIFQAKLGSLYDKTLRLQRLASRIAERLGLEKGEVIRRAAYLAKADLLTEMVGEFPQLQGVMGKEYALKSGEPPEVAEAIFEHYLPRFAGDRLPWTDPGAILSIADKVDTIVGCFGIGLIPTGTSDPFALRRQTLGVINIVLNRSYRLPMGEVVDWALELLGERVQRPPEEVKGEVLEFFRGRYIGLLVGEGYSRDVVEAVLQVQRDDLVDAKARVEAIDALRGKETFSSMIVAFKRVANILKGREYPQEVRPELFREAEERALYQAYLKAEEEGERFLQRGDYSQMLLTLSKLRVAVDAFFDKVLVMTEEEALRANRLALLGMVLQLFLKMADFSLISEEGGASQRL